MERVVTFATDIMRTISGKLFLEFVGEGIFACMSLVTAIIAACDSMDLIGFNFGSEAEIPARLDALAASITNKSRVSL
jgi:hypothetical protein